MPRRFSSMSAWRMSTIAMPSFSHGASPYERISHIYTPKAQTSDAKLKRFSVSVSIDMYLTGRRPALSSFQKSWPSGSWRARPKSPILTRLLWCRRMLRAARSLWMKRFEVRYTMPAATWCAKVSISCDLM